MTYVTIWQHGKIYGFYKTNEYDKPVIADVVLKYIQTLYKPTNSGQIDDDAAADAAADAAYRKVSFGGTPSQVNESLLGRELLIKGIVDEFQEMQSDNQVHIWGIMCEEGNRNAYVRFGIDGTKRGTLIKWARDYVKRGYETRQLMFIKGTLKPLNGQFYIDVTEAGFIR